jgi:hypothetical protein
MGLTHFIMGLGATMSSAQPGAEEWVLGTGIWNNNAFWSNTAFYRNQP